VDADSAPKEVLEVCLEAASVFSAELWTVASFNHNINCGANHITVGNGSQEADMKIANMAGANDVVVTQDYGLAALALAKGAAAISPWGKVYRTETIDFLLEEREVKARVRRGGGKTKGPTKRSLRDNENFKKNLFQTMRKVHPGKPNQ
jgi:uncharacterized protein YaiI (UPF0178 family)